MALIDDRLPYIATALSSAALVLITFFLREPPHARTDNARARPAVLLARFTDPTLLWLLCLALVMYAFSHIPFVFGQPFIREALANTGYAAQTPLVSGAVSFTMMLLSIAVSLVALPLRNRLGVPAMLLLAFAMQIGLIIALALSNSALVIGLLFLRMVPDSLSQPFMRARIQPLLSDDVRATYFSVQSLAGRILFAATLGLATGFVADAATLPYADMQRILGAYAIFGLVLLVTLALTARRARV